MKFLERFTSRRYRIWIAISSICIASLLLVIAPVYVPAGYSIVSHWISALASQGTPNAWIAKLGFLLFALGVWCTGSVMDMIWPQYQRTLLEAAAVGILLLAVFGYKPWIAGAYHDSMQTLFHNIATALVVVSVAVLLLARSWIRRHERSIRVMYDHYVMLVAVISPIVMVFWSQYHGVMQRLLFGSVALWLLLELRVVWRQRDAGLASPDDVTIVGLPLA